jgi:N-dimethylarginine dimethylaminohydrolase
MKQLYGSQSMIAPLRRVVVKRPDEAFGAADPFTWHYTDQPDLEKAQEEHDGFVKTLRQVGAEVIYNEVVQPNRADAIYVHDPVIVTDRGAIILQMGKPLREGEETAMATCLAGLGVPIHYQLHGPARAEGGDLLWIDPQTLAVGQGFRTNAAGLQQLREVLEPDGIAVMPVQLPYYLGPEACLHLMSFISIVDERLAVIYEPLMPVPFWLYLKARGFHFICVPDEEFPSMGANVLAIAPGVCLMLEGNPITQQQLTQIGCEVQTYKGNEISLKAEGGATCLTRPILRG